MSAPVILVTSGLATTEHSSVIGAPRTYSDAIAAAGGIPLMSSVVADDELAVRCDGLLLTGGEDVDPARYHDEVHYPSVAFSVERDEAEFRLTEAFIRAGKPIMAICRGFQVLNVVLGGTLYQDLPEELGFIHFDRALRHRVIAGEGTLLYRLFGREFRVNSTHHQAVRKPGEGLIVTARSPEGIVEAYEHTFLPIVGTQFHPERLVCLTDDQRTPDFLPLFQHFVQMCVER